jgi:hypothetical protein
MNGFRFQIKKPPCERFAFRADPQPLLYILARTGTAGYAEGNQTPKKAVSSLIEKPASEGILVAEN